MTSDRTSTPPRRPPLAREHARLAVLAVRAGDPATAERHLTVARRAPRARARRDRQIVEIATLMVLGDRTRAEGLLLEHAAEFPGDAALLEGVQGRMVAIQAGDLRADLRTSRSGSPATPSRHGGSAERR